jgi:hypothetical protein
VRLEDLKRLAAARLPGHRVFGYACLDDPMQKSFLNRWEIRSSYMCIGTEAAHSEATFLEACANNIDALIAVVEAFKRDREFFRKMEDQAWWENMARRILDTGNIAHAGYWQNITAMFRDADEALAALEES